MLRAVYDRLLALAAHRHAERWMAGVSFTESSVFPVPPDAMLLPMCLARPDRAWRYAAICTAASVLGGIAGYLLGFFLYEALAEPLLTAYGQADALATFEAWFDEWGLIAVLVAGLTPVPYKALTIAAGAASFNIAAFILASLLARGLRFFLLAALLRHYGEPMRAFIERRLALLTTLAAGLLVGGILVLRAV